MKISKNAMKKWNQFPREIQNKLLNNVYCSKCADAVRIKDFDINLDKNDLILKGKCAICDNNVVRLIEG